MTAAERAREWLSSAKSIAVLTGAGISAESGIPTFRDQWGRSPDRPPLWNQFRPEDLATPQAFARDPKFVWEWYDWRRSLIAKAEPNAGHLALAELERRKPNFTLITQNVDGLHDRAGSTHVLKVHGDIWTLRCTLCSHERHDPRPSLPELPPKCNCGAIERPGVVWFGENLPPEIWAQAEQAAEAAGVFLVVGTSALVYPAAGLVHLAKASGAKVVEVNPAETPVSGMVDFSWRAAAAEALPQLL
ncbi:MAG: NAD-dependent deacylase [Acidobacteriia bacterium]|nr:NAD-dependent deacylase [Terriglobia bacterium]